MYGTEFVRLVWFWAQRQGRWLKGTNKIFDFIAGVRSKVSTCLELLVDVLDVGIKWRLTDTWLWGVYVWAMVGIPSWKPWLIPSTKRGYFPSKPCLESSLYHALALYVVKPLVFLSARAKLGTVIGFATAGALVIFGVGGWLTASWKLPVETDGEAFAADQTPLFVSVWFALWTVP
jgi:hypothetical protein